MAEVTIEIRPNGPYLVKGPLRYRDEAGGEEELSRPWIALCRCGRSANKPFCDGSHADNFEAPGGTLQTA